MIRTMMMVGMAAVLGGGLLAADTNETPKVLAERNRAYAARYAKSLAVVRYYTQKNADGKEFKSQVPYICPGCGHTHWRAGDESSEKNIPAEFAGFLIAPDKVLMQDVRVKPEFVARIEVQIGGEIIPATEFEACSEREALVLKTEKAFSAAVPLQFTGREPERPQYFYLVCEDGGMIAGIKPSKIAEFDYHVKSGRIICKGNPNTLVLDEQGKAVTVALQTSFEFGKECFAAPSAWPFEPAARRFEFLTGLETQLRQSVMPIYVQLEAPSKEEGGNGRFYFSSSDSVPNEMDSVGVVLANGQVLIPLALDAKTTARLAKVEATLPDGSKVELAFVGSFAEQGAFVASLPNSVKGLRPLAFDRRPASKLYREFVYPVEVVNRGGGKLQLRATRERVNSFDRERDNERVLHLELDSETGDDRDDTGAMRLAVTAAGELVTLQLSDRKERRSWRSRNGVFGSAMLKLVDQPPFDPENVPRIAGDRQRTAWLGVELQTAGADIVREKRAASYLGRYVERAALVTEVISNTPAATLGIKEGDILISARFPGSSNSEELSMGYGDSMFDWGELFDQEGFAEFGGMSGQTPWPNVEEGVNSVLTRRFGVGAEVVIAWVSDGERKEGTVKLALAPVHYANAPKARNKQLGITVCDMTYEVRKYFKFDEKASGVVVKKVKGAGPAAVAGIKPLELITMVNGEEVHSAKEFMAKTKGQTELTFSVRRLTATRIVPIKMQEAKE